MDAQPATPAAPAQPAAAPEPTISATRAAANAGNFAAFDQAHVAQKTGKPLPDVTAAAAQPETNAKAAAPAAPAQPEERPVSKRQQQINDYERRIAEQNERIARLESQLTPGQKTPPAPAQAEKPATAAEWKRYTQMADAPKLADFDTVEEHTAAMALFVADTRHAERIAADRDKQESDARVADFSQRADGYAEKLRAAKTADPEIASKIAPALLAARPLSALSEQEAASATFANAVAEIAFHSDNPAALYLHLSAHEADAAAIAALPPADALRALTRLDGRLSGTAAKTETPSPATPPTREPVTTAPPPPPTLSKPGTSTDTKASALARGDFLTFDRLEMAERRATRQRA